MHRRLTRNKYSFYVIQGVSDQSVKGSEVRKGGHGWASGTRGGEEDESEKKEQETILYLSEAEDRKTWRGNSLRQKWRVQKCFVFCCR
jgi:hypothetical protein